MTQKRLNVCIIPTGDRSGQINLIHHYSKIGARVFLPRHGTDGLNWRTTATWPGLLMRSLRQPDKRNLEIHGFRRKNNITLLGRVVWGNIFGEDRFIVKEDNGELYPDKTIACELIDFNKEQVPIDLFHTPRCSAGVLENLLGFADRYFPKAVWVSSALLPDCHRVRPEKLKNICKTMPLPQDYWEKFKNLNYFNSYPSGFEFELLNVRPAKEPRQGFASFCHNFEKRYPQDYQFLQNVNAKLKSQGIFIPNYGGNIYTQGADIKYHRRGPTGEFPTLSIRKSARLTSRLKAVVQFKQGDYGGGVVWYSLMAGTPIVTHRDYVLKTGADKLLVHGHNSMIVETTSEAAKAILKIEQNDAFRQKLARGMRETFVDKINPGYWDRFENFIQRALAQN